MRNRKGFTLIEMMVVIAIIAVLVAVIIPVVGNSTQKANAATNAANLRSVEGELTAMMLINPGAFGDKLDQQGQIDQGREQVRLTKEELAELQKEVDQLKLDLNNWKESVKEERANLETEKNRLEDLNDPITLAQLNIAASLHSGCSGWSWSSWSYTTHSDTCKQAQAAAAEANNAAAELVTVYAEIARYNATELEKAGEIALKQGIIDGGGVLNDAYSGALDSAENALYTYTAVDGFITLEDGTTLKAPDAKEVDKDGVVVNKDTPMVVYVNAYNRTFKATYAGAEEGTEYDKIVFANLTGEAE